MMPTTYKIAFEARADQDEHLTVAFSECYSKQFLRQIMGFCALSLLASAMETGDQEMQADFIKILDILGVHPAGDQLSRILQ